MNYIKINGIDSRSFKGLLISELPPITKPQIRTEVEEIDGKDGEIVTELGYSAYDRTLSIGLFGNYNLDEIINFFNSKGEIIFSNEPDKIYKFAIYQNIDFERLASFKKAEVVFRCQPFKNSTLTQKIEFEPIIAKATGRDVFLNPTTAKQTLKSLKLYGECSQNGTPTAVSPVEIKPVTQSNLIEFYNSDATQGRVFTVGLSSEELCKISDYQDFIHYSGEWKKRTAIGKHTVSADEVSRAWYGEGDKACYGRIPIPTDALSFGTNFDVKCLCTHAIYEKQRTIWNDEASLNKIYVKDNYFMIGFPPNTSLAEVRTALNGAVIYYVLLNRIDVPLTNEALIKQLNAVMGFRLYDEETEIATDSGNGVILNIEVVSSIQVFSVKNLGNIYSRPKFKIFGNGTVNITINDIPRLIAMVDEYITIDCAELEAYKDNTLKNRQVSGNYNNIKLDIGNNEVIFSGDIKKVEVENYSRWI